MKSIFYTGQTFPKSLLVLLFLAFSASLFAQQASITVQGVLTKADGSAVEDDVYDMTFRLWNHPDATGAANKKHEELITDVETVGGVYTVILGVNGTPLNAGFDEVYYLGVSMNSSNVELLPRPRLTHAPYALGIKGNNNTFPSTGPVIGDAFRARGGQPIGGQGSDGNGFSFKPGGDEAGGMYSREPNNIELWAGGQERIQLNNSQNEIYGQTVNFGPFICNDFTVNGNQQINGASTITNGQTVSNGQTVNGNQTVNGIHTVIGKVLTNSDGGYSFNYDGGFDSGMFGSGIDGTFSLRSNGGKVLDVSPGFIGLGPNSQNNAPDIMLGGDILLNNSTRMFVVGGNPGGASGTIRRQNSTGLLWVDNSSRRYKTNIQPLEDDFRKILDAQPRVYNRIANPGFEEIGYIAEEMDSIGLNRLVEYNNDGSVEGLNYERMIIYAVELIKEQDKEIKALNAALVALKAELTTSVDKNKALTSENQAISAQQAAFSAQLEALTKRIQSVESMGNSRK